MRQLEERLGVRLLHRTTRSVSLTDAGRRLLDRLRPAIDQIAGALENLNQERQRPMRRLRIYAIHTAAAAIVGPTAQLALQHDQLLPQRGILCFKPALGLEQRRAQAQEEEYQRDHRGRR